MTAAQAARRRTGLERSGPVLFRASPSTATRVPAALACADAASQRHGV